MKVGIQLYSVRGALEKDPAGTLAEVCKLGYRYLELALGDAEKDPGGFGLPAAELRALLDGNGAKLAGAHVRPLEPDGGLERILEYHAALGNPNVGQSFDFFDSLDDVKRKAERFHRIGERCKAYGLRFYYHNHFQEFKLLDGRPALYHLAELTDPELVFFELDTFWAVRGGQDPVEVIRTLGKRLILLHQKDYAKDFPGEQNLFAGAVDMDAPFDMKAMMGVFDPGMFAEIGTGVLPIQRYLDAAAAAGCEYVILEQDATKLPEMESIRVSMNEFRKFSGMEWE